MTNQIIIVGASHAGISCAEQLRANGYARRICIIDRLAGMPLERPPLSKAFLQADGHDDAKFIMRLYSMETFLFRILNRACREKDTSRIKTLGPFAVALSRIIDSKKRNQTDKDAIKGRFSVYRCMSLTPG